MATILIAETDQPILEILPRLLSERISHLAIDLCDSAEDLSSKLRKQSYDTVAMNPVLVPEYRVVNRRKLPQSLAPLLLTEEAAILKCP